MKKILALLAAALLNAGTHAEELNVTFGAGSDLAAKYGEHDLTGNAKQNADIAAPYISIGGLDLDGLGANDDKIEVKFAVTAMLKRIVLCGLLLAGCVANAAERWDALYEPQVFEGMPCRVMKPLGFDSRQSYPVIVSLHGAGGRGTNNDKQLKDWNRQLAEPQRREDFPCYVVAPQAAGLWNAEHFRKIKAIIKKLPSVDMDRIYILGHSMGGHGTYIFIQLDPDYFAAAAPSAGSGLRRTEDFIDAAKIKDLPIWAFHGDKDGVCPIEKDQRVFDEMKRLGGNMKFTVWQGDNHGVSSKMIAGGNNGITHFSSDRCDEEPDFMTWLFAQSRKKIAVVDHVLRSNQPPLD